MWLIKLAVMLSAFSASATDHLVSRGPDAIQTEGEIRNIIAKVQQKELQASELGDLPKILSILVANTKFSGRVNVNGTLEQSKLNVYILAPHLGTRPDAPEEFFAAGVFDNCAYTGIENTIICDSDFLSGFLTNHGVDSDSSDKTQHELGWTFQDSFLAWIFGHELGHAVEGEPGAHFGGNNTFRKPVDVGVELSQTRETRADLFAAKQIESNDKLTKTLERMLIDLLNEEIEKKNGKSPAYGVGLNWDYADKSVVKYFADRDHPEYVVRATRMLQTVATDTHEEGLQALLDSFARHLAPAVPKQN